MSSLGKKLRTKRLERNATQVQVAQALGVTQASLSMIEEGEFEPDDELHGKIVRWLASGATPGKASRGPYKKR